MGSTSLFSIVTLACMLCCWANQLGMYQWETKIRSQHADTFRTCQRICHNLGHGPTGCRHMHYVPNKSKCYIYVAQCITGWDLDSASKVCYKLITGPPVTFVQASQSCAQMKPKARLLVGKYMAPSVVLGLTKGNKTWIGALSDPSRRTIKWTDGTPFNAAWRSVPSQTSFTTGDECVLLENNAIRDRVCKGSTLTIDFAEKYLCELVF